MNHDTKITVEHYDQKLEISLKEPGIADIEHAFMSILKFMGYSYTTDIYIQKRADVIDEAVDNYKRTNGVNDG